MLLDITHNLLAISNWHCGYLIQVEDSVPDVIGGEWSRYRRQLLSAPLLRWLVYEALSSRHTDGVVMITIHSQTSLCNHETISQMQPRNWEWECHSVPNCGWNIGSFDISFDIFTAKCKVYLQTPVWTIRLRQELYYSCETRRQRIKYCRQSSVHLKLHCQFTAGLLYTIKCPYFMHDILPTTSKWLLY